MTAEIRKALDDLDQEIDYAKKWGTSFDDLNTANDWCAYITMYAGDACKMPAGEPGKPFDYDRFRKNMIKVASLAIHAVAAVERGGPAPRHYDLGGLL